MLSLTSIEKEYLLNMLKRKELACEHIVKNQQKYNALAVGRAKTTLKICRSLINKIKKESTEDSEKKQAASDPEILARIEELETRIEQLEVWKELTQPIIKKLVAYHQGEV